MKENTKNNVWSINQGRRFRFLHSEFYLHNRSESFEEKFLFFGMLFSFLTPLVITGLTFGVFSFVTVASAGSLLTGALVGYFILTRFPFKVERYFEKELPPKEITEDDFQMKNAA